MNGWNEFGQTTLRAMAAEVNEATGRIQRFSTLDEEYRVLHDGAAVVDRNYASVLEVTGADRASWLHNLTTNQIKNLGVHEGVYAFATNVQGRIIFDLQVLNFGERIWCVINHSRVENAVKHLDRYIITEDVTMTDRSQDFVRLGLGGAGVPEVLNPHGVGHAGAMASLGVATCRIASADVVAVRTDFCGTLGVDLFVSTDQAAAVWKTLSNADSKCPATPIGDAVIEIARIEAGLPCPLRELTDDVLPAETGQFDSAVSHTKGCYLGQEIVERMRSRGVVARVLSGITLAGDATPPAGAAVRGDDGSVIGAVTSSCHSLALGSPIGLAYLKFGSHEPGTAVRVAWNEAGEDHEASGTVAALPFTGAPVH